MDKLICHMIANEQYMAIVTILDYEIRTNQYLSELSFAPMTTPKKKVIVDFALKTGVNKYRFVEYDLNKDGKMIISTSNYVSVSNEVKKIANYYLQEKREIVMNSILTDTKKKEVLDVQR